jgi:hypothetical protein
MLILDPFSVDRWAKTSNPFLTERRRGISLDQIAKRPEFQRPGAAVGKLSRHKFMLQEPPD